ncbi:Rrp15p-domain-containing protein [Aureobasidium subglaciale]|nr:Rrp15p-domain-containing protein [Aureobasidium subglaciale]
MGNPSAKRKRPEGMGYRKPKKLVKKFKKQKAYHSDSEDDHVQTTNTTSDFKPVDMDDSDEEVEDAPAPAPAPASASAPAPVPTPAPVVEEKKKDTSKPTVPAKSEPMPAPVQPKLKSALKQSKKADPPSESDEDEDEDDDDDDVEDLDALDDEDLDDEDLDDEDLEDDDELDLSDDEDGEGRTKKTRKRNDPTAFATSMSKILGTKLTTSKRQDPVLSRSAAATAASKELADQKLELKAKRKMHAEKREALEKGRVKDVLGLNTPEVSTAVIQETEKRLQKTAQRGVVKLFNAVRAAQVQGEQARSEAKKEGVIGISQREERVSEMSKKGFLDLIATGGKKPAAVEA